MQITITDIYTKDGEGKKGKWHLTKLTDENDEKYSSFDQKARAVNIGDVLDIEFSEDDKGNNLDSFTVVEKATAPGAARHDDTRNSIEKQVSLKCACDVLPEGSAISNYLSYAQDFYEWLRNGTEIATEVVRAPSEPPRSEPPATPLLEDIAGIVANLETLKAAGPELWEDIKVIGGLMNKYKVKQQKTVAKTLGQLNKMQLAEFGDVVQKKALELTNVPPEDLPFG